MAKVRNIRDRGKGSTKSPSSTLSTNTNEVKQRRVTLLRDTFLTFPELWLEVFVFGPEFEVRPFAELFMRSKCSKAESPLKADLVVFVGGEDVDPLLYGETAHPMTGFNPKRDKEDIELFDLCYNKGIPMMGVCRGAQFGHVMMGGKLYQHVDNHNGDHPIYDRELRRSITKVSSVHHQMVRPNPDGGMEVIADTYKSHNRYLNDKEKDTSHNHPDIEAFFYRDACFFGVQGHPEYKGYPEFAAWTMTKLNQLICENPDLSPKGGYYRIKPEVLETRTQRTSLERVYKELC